MEDKNIFKGAKFGNKYITKNNEIAIYSHSEDGNHMLLLEGGYLYVYDSRGWYMGKDEDDLDNIVGRYHEEIDEVYLNKLYKEYTLTKDSPFTMEEDFKAGYRKAKEF